MTKQEKRSTAGINVIGMLAAIMVVSWLMSVSYYAFAFFALGMLPAIMALVIDRGVNRFASKTVLALNFAGILPFLFDIAQSPDKSFAAQQRMFDLWVWLLVYSAAGMGWLMIWLVPQIMVAVFAFRVEYKIKRFRNRQEELRKEWGDELLQGNEVIKVSDEILN
jgi:hypothetical protein